jgi:hypothetical protein
VSAGRPGHRCGVRGVGGADGEATPCRKMPCLGGSCCCIWRRRLHPTAAAATGEGGEGRQRKQGAAEGREQGGGAVEGGEQGGGGCLFGALSLSLFYICRWWLARVKRGV